VLDKEMHPEKQKILEDNCGKKKNVNSAGRGHAEKAESLRKAGIWRMRVQNFLSNGLAFAQVFLGLQRALGSGSQTDPT